jgi:2-iminoacetate synthase ThiH
MTEKKPTDPESPLVENLDYYMERGYLVFTAYYHLKRGHCCKSGCRHCPYRKKDEKSGQKPEK